MSMADNKRLSLFWLLAGDIPGMALILVDNSEISNQLMSKLSDPWSRVMSHHESFRFESPMAVGHKWWSCFWWDSIAITMSQSGPDLTSVSQFVSSETKLEDRQIWHWLLLKFWNFHQVTRPFIDSWSQYCHTSWVAGWPHSMSRSYPEGSVTIIIQLLSVHYTTRWSELWPPLVSQFISSETKACGRNQLWAWNPSIAMPLTKDDLIAFRRLPRWSPWRMTTGSPWF